MSEYFPLPLLPLRTFRCPVIFQIFQSYEQLVEKLTFAIEETEGFGQEWLIKCYCHQIVSIFMQQESGDVKIQYGQLGASEGPELSLVCFVMMGIGHG